MPSTTNKPPQVDLTGKLKWVESIAHLLDDKFRIPGTKFRFGLDPIMNLIPFAGDVSGFLVGATLVWVMARHGVSRKVLILMGINICVDALIGAIPFAGQVFDFYYKSNTRNIKLLKEHYEEGKYQGQGTGVLIVVVLVLLVFFAAFLFLLYIVARWVAGRF
jgi:NAD/NADP transhydrogenase beta subunit